MFLLTLFAQLFLIDDVQSSNLEGGFVSNLVLSIAASIGLVATFLVFRNASKIGGGTLTRVYKFFAAGMLSMVCGVMLLLLPPDSLPFGLSRASGILFIIGFTIMGVGANKILDAAGIK